MLLLVMPNGWRGHIEMGDLAQRLTNCDVGLNVGFIESLCDAAIAVHSVTLERMNGETKLLKESNSSRARRSITLNQLE